MMNVEIVSIGTELLLGEIVDTNSTYIARQLRDIGVSIYYLTTVGDNLERIATAIRTALDRADVVLSTALHEFQGLAVMEAVAAVAPWAVDKINYLEMRIQRAGEHLQDGDAIVAVHACGVRTDRCIDLALTLRSPMALLPCCYSQTAATAPRALRKALGADLATDVHRTTTSAAVPVAGPDCGCFLQLLFDPADGPYPGQEWRDCRRDLGALLGGWLGGSLDTVNLGRG